MAAHKADVRQFSDGIGWAIDCTECGNALGLVMPDGTVRMSNDSAECKFGEPEPKLKTFQVSWTFGGTTSVKAVDEDDARNVFRELDHREILDESDADLDVSDIYEGEA